MRNQKGFTLLELLIVIGILGALVAIALPRYENAVAKARHRACGSNIRAINTAIELYNISEGAYPATSVILATAILTNVNYFPDEEPRCEYVADGLDNVDGYRDSYITTGSKYRIDYVKHPKTFTVGTPHTE